MKIQSVIPDVVAAVLLGVVLVVLSESGTIHHVQNYPYVAIIAGYSIGRLVSILWANKRATR